MLKLKITAIGTPKDVQTRFGLKQSNYIKAEESEYKGNYLNYFLGDTTKDWAVGQEIEVESIEKKDYTGRDGSLKTSYNIRLPKFGGNGDVMKALERLENNSLTRHLLVMQGLKEVFEVVSGRNSVLVADKSTYTTPEEAGIPETGPTFEPDDGLDQMNAEEVFNSI